MNEPSWSMISYSTTNLDGVIKQVIPAFPGVFIVDTGPAQINIPLLHSISSIYANDHQYEAIYAVINDLDDQVMILPGFKISIYQHGDYSGTEHTYDNGGGTEVKVYQLSHINQATSFKIYFNNTEIIPYSISKNRGVIVYGLSTTVSEITYNDTEYIVFTSLEYIKVKRNMTLTDVHCIIVGGGGAGGTSNTSGWGDGGGGGGRVISVSIASLGSTTDLEGKVGRGGRASSDSVGGNGSSTTLKRGYTETAQGGYGGQYGKGSATTGNGGNSGNNQYSGSTGYGENVISGANNGGGGGGGGGAGGNSPSANTGNNGKPGGPGAIVSFIGGTYGGGGGGGGFDTGGGGAGGSGGGGYGGKRGWNPSASAWVRHNMSTNDGVNGEPGKGGGGGGGFYNGSGGHGGCGCVIIGIKKSELM